ncbi:MAG TPA: hypothetical protein VE027_13535 [Acidimicrobiia bacterium]|nr:hypothetical protein [Acidimicrobiia bacterium]
MSLTTPIRQAATSVAAAALAVGAAALPANAQDVVFPGCPGFDVGITFGDSHGNPEQIGPRAVLLAGTSTFTLDNETTGATTTVRTAGALVSSKPGPNGSTINTVAGPNVLILFPTDPGGPSTTLYPGRLVFSQSADGVTTIISSSGASRDLCAALGA